MYIKIFAFIEVVKNQTLMGSPLEGARAPTSQSWLQSDTINQCVHTFTGLCNSGKCVIPGKKLRLTTGRLSVNLHSTESKLEKMEKKDRKWETWSDKTEKLKDNWCQCG